MKKYLVEVECGSDFVKEMGGESLLYDEYGDPIQDHYFSYSFILESDIEPFSEITFIYSQEEFPTDHKVTLAVYNAINNKRSILKGDQFLATFTPLDEIEIIKV